MFSLFKKKESALKVDDIVFAKKAGKYNALADAAKQNPQQLFVAWFEASLESLQQFFQQNGVTAEVMHYRQLYNGIAGNKTIIFIEHHPLLEKEKKLFQSFAANKIIVYSSLDEPLLKHFGGDRINALLQNLGVKENEPISHSLITKSIAKAQQKLASKLTIEQSADSMEEWMQKNIDVQ